MSRDALARRAGVTEKTVYNWEMGKVELPRERLVEIGRALDLRVEATNEILTAAGFDPEPTGPLARIAAERTPEQELQRELASYVWPCLVMNERYEIVGWNEAANLVAELDFARDLPTAFERNLLRISAMPHFFVPDDEKRRVVNWDEIISALIGLYKHNQVDIEQAEEESRYFARMVEEIASKFGAALPRMMTLWNSAPPYTGGRVRFPAVWRLNDGTILRFNCILYPWNDFDALWAFDWFPADGATWDWLGARLTGAVVEGAREASPAADGVAARDGSFVPFGGRTWNQLLRLAREGTGLTREALKDLSGVPEHTQESYEVARRRPAWATLLRLTRAMQLDTATINAILTRAGLEPEPSDWALILADMPRRTDTKFYPRDENTNLTWEQIQAEIDTFSWPSIMLNDRWELTGQNRLSVRVTGLDIRRRLPDPTYRNAIAFAISPFARERLVNWEEVATALIPDELRAVVCGTATARVVTDWGGAVAELRRREPEAMERLAAFWRDALHYSATRTVFPVRWRAEGGGVLSFHAVLSWQTHGIAWAMDWHPADGATWGWLAEDGRDL